MDPRVFGLGPILTARTFDEEHHNLTVTTRLPFIRWPGRDRMPKDRESRQFRDKASDAVDAFAVELEERLKGENRPALLKLGHDQRQFYAYVSEEVTKRFIAENWLNPPRHVDLDPASSDDGKSPEKDPGKKP